MKSMIDNPNKDTLNFNHPIQRKGGVWSIDAASSLIHSILMNSLYPIPSLYCLKSIVLSTSQNIEEKSVANANDSLILNAI